MGGWGGGGYAVVGCAAYAAGGNGSRHPASGVGGRRLSGCGDTGFIMKYITCPRILPYFVLYLIINYNND